MSPPVGAAGSASGVPGVTGVSQRLRQSEKSKGLVPHLDEWMYVCEFDDCEDDWCTSVVSMAQVPALVEMYKMHVSQRHDKKGSAEQEKFD